MSGGGGGGCCCLLPVEKLATPVGLALTLTSCPSLAARRAGGGGPVSELLASACWVDRGGAPPLGTAARGGQSPAGRSQRGTLIPVVTVSLSAEPPFCGRRGLSCPGPQPVGRREEMARFASALEDGRTDVGECSPGEPSSSQNTAQLLATDCFSTGSTLSSR